MKSQNHFIPRPKYMQILEKTREMPMIKIIIGMRRCGKSALLEMFRDSQMDNYSEDRLYYRRFDEELEGDLPDHRKLIDDVKSKVPVEPGTLILLDEIQDVDGWERAVMTFFTSGADVYITGSNARMLSSDLSTKLSGRFVEIEVLPLSFREYIQFRDVSVGESDPTVLFEEYWRNGSLPAVAVLKESQTEMIPMIVSGVFNTVFVKDVLERNNVRNVMLMNNINRYLLKNVGNRVSVKKSAGYLTSMGIKTTPATIDNYIGMLESAMLFHRAMRIDSLTSSYLMTSDKFYCNDLGIRNMLVGCREADMNGILENLVYMELRYRYGDVSVLSTGRYEVDFVVNAAKNPRYFQACYDLSETEARTREVRSLKLLDDNYPKTIITWLRYPLDDIDGIKVIPVTEWLLEDD